jgi:HEXXH motif-containing protein
VSGGERHRVTPPLLRCLAELLTWSETGSLATLEASLLDALTTDLGLALGRLSRFDPPSATNLLENLRRLSDHSFARLITAPQLYFCLRGLRRRADALSVRAVGCFLGSSIDGEQRIVGKAGSGSDAVWTALGDWYFPRETSAQDLVADADPLTWAHDAVYCAPRLAIGPSVDFFSPFGRGDLPEVSGGDIPFSRAERRHVLDKLDESLVALRTMSPISATFVSALTKVILPRKDPGPDRQYRAASTPLSIGRPVLRNPDLPDATTPELIDGIVHETIHAIIDIVELTEPLIIEATALGPRLITSPWTGRQLDLNTYLQACFVWYGLWNLWCQALGSESPAASSAIHYACLAARGFCTTDITDPLADMRRGLAPDLLEILDELQRRVRAAVAKSGSGSVDVRPVH